MNDEFNNISRDLINITKSAIENNDISDSLNKIEIRIKGLKNKNKDILIKQVNNLKELINVSKKIDTYERQKCKPAFLEYIESTNLIIDEINDEINKLDLYYSKNNDYYYLCDYFYKLNKIKNKIEELICEYDNCKNNELELKNYVVKDPYNLKKSNKILKDVLNKCCLKIKQVNGIRCNDVVISNKRDIKFGLKDNEMEQYGASNTIINYALTSMKANMIYYKNKTNKNVYITEMLEKIYKISIESFPFNKFNKILGLTTSFILINNGIKIILMFISNDKYYFDDRFSVNIKLKYYESLELLDKLDNKKLSKKSKEYVSLIKKYINSFEIK